MWKTTLLNLIKYVSISDEINYIPKSIFYILKMTKKEKLIMIQKLMNNRRTNNNISIDMNTTNFDEIVQTLKIEKDFFNDDFEILLSRDYNNFYPSNGSLKQIDISFFTNIKEKDVIIVEGSHDLFRAYVKDKIHYISNLLNKKLF